MEREELKKTLSQLHQELQSGSSVDPELVALIQQLSADVGRLLVTPETETVPVTTALSETEPSPPSLTDRLLDLASGFEQTHPQLAESIGRVATALSRMGI